MSGRDFESADLGTPSVSGASPKVLDGHLGTYPIGGVECAQAINGSRSSEEAADALWFNPNNDDNPLDTGSPLRGFGWRPWMPAPSPLMFPFCWICLLVITHADNSESVATGWFASERLVITSGRAVYDDERGGKALRVRILPSGGGIGQGGTVIESTALDALVGWVERREPNCDLGCVFLQPSDTQDRGYFGVLCAPTSRLRGHLANVASYLADGGPGFLVFSTLTIQQARRLGTLIGDPAAPLPEGSPVWIRWGGEGQRLVCGMVGSGAASGEIVAVTESVLDRIKTWQDKSRQQLLTQQPPPAP